MHKAKTFIALMTISAGIALMASETFSLLMAHAQTDDAFSNQTVGVSLSPQKGKVFAANYISNIAPGDSKIGTLVITNTTKNESQSENVTIQNILSGDIFRDNGKTGTSLGEAIGPDGLEHGISIDYAAYGENAKWEFDDYPLEISYRIQLSDVVFDKTINVGPFSTNNTSPTFILDSGKKAIVTYKYIMPSEAHNDYQGTTGNLDITVSAFANNTPPHGGHSNPPPGGSPTPPPGGQPIPPPGGGQTPPSGGQPTPPSGSGKTPPSGGQTAQQTGGGQTSQKPAPVVVGATLPTTGVGVGINLVIGLELIVSGISFVYFGIKGKKS